MLLMSQAHAAHREGERTGGKSEMNPLNRRQVVMAINAALGWLIAEAGQRSINRCGFAGEFLVPNFDHANCGWFSTFSREGVYCTNAFGDEIDL